MAPSDTKRVLLLGGAGGITRLLLPVIAADPRVGAVTVAGEDAGALHGAAAACGGAVRLRYVDASDGEALAERMSEADIALGVSAPGSRHEPVIVAAALEAGTHYLSASPGPGAAAALLDREPDIDRAGLCCIGGLAWTPGIGSLLALRAAKRFSEVAEIRLTMAERMPLAGSEELGRYLERFAAPGMDEGRPGSWEQWELLPPPLATASVVHAASAEPVWLRRALPGARVTVKAGFGAPAAGLLVRSLAWAFVGARDDTRGIVSAVADGFFRRLSLSRGPDVDAALRLEIAGRSGRGWERRVLGASGGTVATTGSLLLLALDGVLEGMVPPGLHGPEALEATALEKLAAGGMRLWSWERGRAGGTLEER